MILDSSCHLCTPILSTASTSSSTHSARKRSAFIGVSLAHAESLISVLTITGTWVLTDEDVLEPPRKLKEAMAWKDLPETGVFDVCDIGESREY
jgi:hypothetical protein